MNNSAGMYIYVSIDEDTDLSLLTMEVACAAVKLCLYTNAHAIIMPVLPNPAWQCTII